jgi:hypothetical protein
MGDVERAKLGMGDQMVADAMRTFPEGGLHSLAAIAAKGRQHSV